ncbi:MAG: hypothetical protein KJ072_05445 [Verrucomicrobia bacterium]|nr:hypothetical protein [Verrucomicrobiota bacterium]
MTNIIQTGRPHSEVLAERPARALYVACPILLALLLGLSLTAPHGIALYAFYAIAVVAALPTWDRRFVRELSLAAAVFVLLDAALMQGSLDSWQRFLSSLTGLLAIWAGLHLSLETIAAYEARLQEALRRAQAIAHASESTGNLVVLCAWTKRVKEDGKWVPLEEFLERHLQVRVSHGMSDEVHQSMVDQATEAEPEKE